MRDPVSRKKRIARLKKAILFTIAAAIIIPTFLAVFFGIRLHSANKKNDELKQTVYNLQLSLQELRSGAEDTEENVPLYDSQEVAVSSREDGACEDEETKAVTDGMRKVYLTFDDGPSTNTDRILDILADYGVKATFFVLGKDNELYKDDYERIVLEGHTLAMHSYSHKYNEIYSSVDAYEEDLTKLQNFLYDRTGVWCHYVRFPGGSSNTVSSVPMTEIIDYCNANDITYFDWNVVSGDATSGYLSKEQIFANCTSKLNTLDEAIILMHDSADRNSTVDALPDVIEYILDMDDTLILPISDDTIPVQHIAGDTVAEQVEE